METVSRKLQMTFGSADAKNVNVTLYDHRNDLTSEIVADTMVEITALEVLTNTDGVLMTDALAAKEIVTTENTFF